MAKTYDENGRIPPAATPDFATKNGVAVRRFDKFQNTDVGSVGWLNGTPVAKSNPEGSDFVAYGPSAGKIWEPAREVSPNELQSKFDFQRRRGGLRPQRLRAIRRGRLPNSGPSANRPGCARSARPSKGARRACPWQELRSPRLSADDRPSRSGCARPHRARLCPLAARFGRCRSQAQLHVARRQPASPAPGEVTRRITAIMDEKFRRSEEGLRKGGRTRHSRERMGAHGCCHRQERARRREGLSANRVSCPSSRPSVAAGRV